MENYTNGSLVDFLEFKFFRHLTGVSFLWNARFLCITLFTTIYFFVELF
jgi:hypothetical protein